MVKVGAGDTAIRSDGKGNDSGPRGWGLMPSCMGQKKDVMSLQQFPEEKPMALVLFTGQSNSARDYLLAARKSRTQADIAKQLGVSVRNLRRALELGEVEPPVYLVPALQQLLPLEIPLQGEPAFRFIDLFAGIGGIRTAFESIGGHCVFTSEWDTYAQKTYAKNYPDGHPIQGDITQVRAEDIPPHDVLLQVFRASRFPLPACRKRTRLVEPMALRMKRKARCSSTSAASSRTGSHAPSCSKMSRI